MDNGKQDGTYCPNCGEDYKEDKSNVKILGRPYSFKDKLNKVIRCLTCGHLHSWSCVKD